MPDKKIHNIEGLPEAIYRRLKWYVAQAQLAGVKVTMASFIRDAITSALDRAEGEKGK